MFLSKKFYLIKVINFSDTVISPYEFTDVSNPYNDISYFPDSSHFVAVDKTIKKVDGKNYLN